MSRDPTIIGIRLNISSKLFELVTSNRRLRARLFYLQYSVCGEKRLLSFQTNQLPFWPTKSESTP